MNEQLIACVPNFSEGINQEVISEIADAIESVSGVKLLHTDAGKAANRTVMTFAGAPESVVEAAFRGIKKAGELIDMRLQKGEHPRMGATDVCPLVPLSHISMRQTVQYAKQLAGRVGRELNIPVYLYEYAQVDKRRSNLSLIRAGEYEGFFSKITRPGWQPDHGPVVFDEKRGATVIGARNILIAYNINLDTAAVDKAKAIAVAVRESGRMVKDVNGHMIINPGTLKSVKAIGWFIPEYDRAQVSMNLTDTGVTPIHTAFEEVRARAKQAGINVTGSELIGLIPLSAMLDAGRYFLNKQQAAAAYTERELIQAAVKAMGLDELQPFDPQERIIEYLTDDIQS